MIKIKICGIRTAAAAMHASEIGADFIGMIFVPNRRRTVSVDDAKKVIGKLRPKSDKRSLTVGLFADQPLRDIIEISESVGLDMVQLCGYESIEYCNQLQIPIIKSIHIPKDVVGTKFVKELSINVEKYTTHGHIVSLDTLVPGLEGGTGESFNWDIASNLSANGYEFMLSGGLSPGNLENAIEKVQPWGVDVSSGVETAGQKDESKISSFIEICHQLTRS